MSSSPARGGDYTNEISHDCAPPAGKATGSTPPRRCGWDDAVIILDPVNREVIESALARGAKDYIGGNCTVSLMLMGLGRSCSRMVWWSGQAS